MSVTLVYTVGSALANSYGPVSYIDAYAESTAWAAQWDATDDDGKAVLAVRATRAIDLLYFTGWPVSDTQALQFPRDGVITPRGSIIADTSIPDAVMRAWAHLASYLSSLDASADPFSVDDTNKLSSITVGPISLAFRQSVGPDGGTFLATVIVPMLRPFGLVGASGAVRLVR